MRENKRSQKFAIAALAALAALGMSVVPASAAAPVQAGTNNTLTGTFDSVAFGMDNTVSAADHTFRDRVNDNEPDTATRVNNTYASGSVAIGNGNAASGDAALVIGNHSKATLNDATAIGHSAEATRVGTVAIGARAIAGEFVANPNVITDPQVTALYTPRQDGADRAVAVGYETRAVGYKSNAIGSSAWALDNHSTAIGSSAKAIKDHS